MGSAPPLGSIALGLAAALAWGMGDFSGGLAARRTGVFRVVAASYALGAVVMAVLAAAVADPVPGRRALAWSAAAGLCGGAGIAALYQALAAGRMGLAAPVSAVVAAVLPVAAGIILLGPPGVPQLAGFGIAAAAVWLLSRPDGAGGRNGLGTAVLAGLGLGGFLVLISRVGPGSLFWPLAVSKVASFLFALSVLLLRPAGPALSIDVLPLALLAGVMDVAANAFFVLASRAGRLDTAAVLSSLYPAVTVLLARLMLKEHTTPAQRAGIAAALGAIALIAS